jgi:hypothetical protein
MAKALPRLMPARTKVLIEQFSWKRRVEGVLVTIKFAMHDYIEFMVNGKVLQEGKDYERVIEDGARGILFKKPSTITGYAVLKVYK